MTLTANPTSLTALENYVESDWAAVTQWSTAAARYRQILGQDVSDPAGRLRLDRHRLWLESALATVLRRHSAAEICLAWSRAAESLIQRAWRLAGGDQTEAVVLALGKLGAQELNLSSDVDLIVIASARELDHAFRITRQFLQLLSRVDHHGFVLRVDFDLRPGGRHSPLVTTPEQLLNHFETQSETWERLAWTRMRVLLGEKNLASQVTAMAERFCYRRYLDYRLLEDLKDLRQKVHALQSHRTDWINLKTDVGGIRDIELFIHALLLIHAGRNRSLRTHSTTAAIDFLAAHRLLPQAEAESLKADYWQLRQIENFLQAREDEQTHLLSANSSQSGEMTSQVAGIRNRVDRIVSSLLGEVQPQRSFPEDLSQQLLWLDAQGFAPEPSHSLWRELKSTSTFSVKTESDEAQRLAFLSLMAQEIAKSSADKTLALSALLDFLRAIRAKAGFFSMILREPRIARDLARTFGASPYLGSILSSRPELLDSYFLRVDDLSSEEWEGFLSGLSERRLLSELIAAGQLLEDHDIDRLGIALSQNADATVLELLDRLDREVGGGPLQVLALGKWGGRELGVKSDLDFVFLCQGQPKEAEHRLARRLISRLTDPQRGGRIYSVDLRLRPSGASGPMLLNETQLIDYLVGSAQAWERQSYLRARRLGSESAAKVRKACLLRGLSATDHGELLKIRLRLFTQQLDTRKFNLKSHPSGLSAIEFTVQIACLKFNVDANDSATRSMIHALGAHDSKWRELGPELLRHYSRLRLIEQLQQLTLSVSGSEVDLGDPGVARLAHGLNVEVADLETHLQRTLAETAKFLRDLDPLSGGR